MNSDADPSYVPELYKKDIIELHDSTIRLLKSYRDSFNDEELSSISEYTNGIIDLYNCVNEPESEDVTVDDVIDTIEEAWQMTGALVKDMMFRRAFILICTNVQIVCGWCKDRMDFEEDVLIEQGVDIRGDKS